MSAKELRFGDDARHALVRGASVLVRAVKATLGPRGRNVVKQRSFGGPTITKDGVSMAKKIELDDPFENMGAQMVKEVSTKVVRVAFRTTGSGALTVGSSAPCVILANSASSTNPSSLVTF